ncbi:MAG: ABC transporter ATP-binding protein [Cellulosilyticaceae bacterium]
MKLIYQYVKRHTMGFVIGVTFLTLEAICDLLQPMMLSKIVDDAVASQNVDRVLYYGGIMLLIALVGAGSAVLRNLCASNISQSIGKEIRFDLYKKIQLFSLENIDRLETASLMTRLTNDVSQIQNFINGCMRILVKAPIICVGAIILIMVQTPNQIPLMVCILTIAFLLIGMNMRQGYPKFRKVQQKLDGLNKVSREYLSLIRVVKAFGQEKYEEERFFGVADALADSSVSAMRVNAFFSPLIGVTVNIGIIVMLWLGNYSGSDIALGKLMASVNYMTQILFALSMVSAILNSMVRASASSKRVKEVFDETISMQEAQMPEDFDLNGGIAFENVTFYYPSAETPTLENINFALKKGMTCGIIGSTGAGKTTLAQLLMRFYDITEGKIYFGGKDISKISSRKLREKIALVSQKPILFTGTIENNLKWGNQKADFETLQKSMKIAHADGFVSELPKGYQTWLGQGGVNLSGGQKQRLSIARGIIKNPEVLILDDCTSALDATTEANVMQDIRNYTQNLTTIIISQRIGTVMSADYILCLEDGNIVGYGTHEALMQTCKIYQEIYVSQIGGV